MPEAGDGVTVVTSIEAGGGYVRADDMVFWAVGDPPTPMHPGQRCVLVAVEIVGGIPVGRLGGHQATPEGAAAVDS
jgi:hypothetical protein